MKFFACVIFTLGLTIEGKKSSFEMEQLDKKTIKNLTGLCRIQCTEEEEEAILQDLKKILSYIDLLNEIDTSDVKPCNQVLEGIVNVWREDATGETMPRETFLSNAPSQVGGLVKVPPVIKQN